jgi:hypothetical protein
MPKMRNISLSAIVIIFFVLLLWSNALAQDSSKAVPGPSARPHISEIMNWLDKNGLDQARVGVRTSSKPARREFSRAVQEDAFPALSLFYAEGFKLVQGDVCDVILKNDDTRLLAHSKLVPPSPPDQHYTAELYIPLQRLSLTKGKGPYGLTSKPDQAQLLGTWRTEFKSNRSQEDVIITLFAAGQKKQLAVWKAETLMFTFDSKETSEKFTAAFRQAIKTCQPVKYLMRKDQ